MHSDIRLKRDGTVSLRHSLTSAVRFCDGRSNELAGLVCAERVGPPFTGLRSFSSMISEGASMVLGPFAKTKGPRLPGRNPAAQRRPIMVGRRYKIARKIH